MIYKNYLKSWKFLNFNNSLVPSLPDNNTPAPSPPAKMEAPLRQRYNKYDPEQEVISPTPNLHALAQ